MEKIKNLKEGIGLTLENRPVTTWVNEIFGYQWESPSEISIHLENAQDKKLGEKLKLLRGGLKSIAKMVKSNLDIKLVSAVSWIITERPRLMETLGFIIDKTSGKAKEYRNKYLKALSQEGTVVPLEKKGVEPGYAYIMREKLLELYD